MSTNAAFSTAMQSPAVSLSDSAPPGSIIVITAATPNADATAEVSGFAVGGTRSMHLRMLLAQIKIIQAEEALDVEGLSMKKAKR